VNCDEFVELVTAFLDGALDPAAESRFVEHIAECDGCETYLHQFRQTIATLGSLPGESLSGEARATLLSAFRDWRG
jgi:anti-sigma factor RsiW